MRGESDPRKHFLTKHEMLLKRKCCKTDTEKIKLPSLVKSVSGETAEGSASYRLTEQTPVNRQIMINKDISVGGEKKLRQVLLALS